MEKQYLADTESLKKEYESLAQHNQEIDDLKDIQCLNKWEFSKSDTDLLV